MRTNIVLDNELLKEAMSFSKNKTKKGVIHEALKEYVNRHKIKGLSKYRGSNLWDDDLEKMRTTLPNETY